VLHPSKHSFQLQLGDNFSLHSLNNTLVSYKIHYTTSKAIRIGLRLGLSDNNSYSPAADPHTDVQETRNANLTLNAIYISYFDVNRVIKPYYGVGPYVTVDYSKYSDIQRGNLSGYNNRQNIGGGLNGLFGIEWFFHNHFSVFSEYGLQGGVTYNFSSSTGVNNTSKQINYQLTGNNFALGVSIYL
jgi:outer membrane protein W